MKKMMLFMAIALIFQTALSQVKDSVSSETNQEMYDFLIAKSKKQNKTGLILLVSGLTATGVGLVIAAQDDTLGSEFTAGAGIYAAGVLTTLSSIPVLIIAGSNKKKAEIYAQTGQHRMIELNLPNSRAVCVGVKIRF